MTIMVLKVDLQCYKCYNKVKKVLCKFPEIHDQVYDEKNNKVMIKVFSCCPERIRDKLCCKGQGCIKSIEILQPPPPPPPKKPDPPPPPKPEPPPPPKPEPPPPPKPEPPPPPKPQPPPPKPEPPPVRTCCSECYAGQGGGPCYSPCYGYGVPIRYYDGYCGRPVYDSWGGGCGCGCGGGGYYGCRCRGYYGCRCGGYYCEQNQSGCSIM